ncbi:MAG: CoB--CoM heterodisulfide reductase iron-sulfur subunit B family protein, partial [Candidatus Zixiibacteriota bacterium]
MKYAPFFGCMITVKYPQMEAAVRKTVKSLGIEFVDLDGFSCCPDPIFFKATDKLTWITIAARNICIAEEAGLDLVTMCSGCTATLSEANFHLSHEPELKEKVNQRLKRIGKEYKGTISVRHIVTVLRDDLGIDRVRESVKKPLGGIKVGIHYGCHLLKPSEIMRVDDPDYPTILEKLFAAIGAKTVHHEKQALCCGKACMSESIPEKMTYDVLTSLKKSGADLMGLICPTCFDEFDLGQIKLARKYNGDLKIPIIYY